MPRIKTVRIEGWHELIAEFRELRHLLRRRLPEPRVRGMLIAGRNGEIETMSIPFKPGQTWNVVAVFTDDTVTPPVTRPLASLPVFSDASGNLILTPDPNSKVTDAQFACLAKLSPQGEAAAAGTSGAISCQAEGDPTPGVNTIKCPDLSYAIAALEDDVGAMTATLVPPAA